MGIELQTSPKPFKSISNSFKTPTRHCKKSIIESMKKNGGSPRAVVIESEGISVVPYFKRCPIPRDSSKFQWSVNELTNQRTITRKENFANGRWSEVPSNLVLPHPPVSWLRPKPVFDEEEISMTSTLKSSLPSSSLPCYVMDESSNDSSSSSKHFSDGGSDSGYCEMENWTHNFTTQSQIEPIVKSWISDICININWNWCKWIIDNVTKIWSSYQ